MNDLPTYTDLTDAALDRLRRARSLTEASVNSSDPTGTLARAGLHVEMAHVYAQLAANTLAAARTVDVGQEQDDPFLVDVDATGRRGALPPF
ncbi:hypothetical protein [Streptomyces laurentii]|uniref:hypothetical protein n=1 Tax=Streptomyces laurentii TaxID=39478 RepID=UPI0033E52949